MLSFILPLVAILFAVVTLILSIISFFKERDNGRFGIGSTIFSAAVTLIGALCISVPSPTIYPLDNDARVYSEATEAIISTINFPGFSTYYSLDGSDPEDGYIYEYPIEITKTTTVSAKTKFLIF